MCSVLPRTYSYSKHKSQLAKLTYTTCYKLVAELELQNFKLYINAKRRNKNSK